MARSTTQCGALLLIALAVAFCCAQEPVVVRLRDAVGDTIDAAERDSFRLFPNTARFQHAVILALPGPEFLAAVTFAGDDTAKQVFFRISSNQLERIRFLIDNREYTTGQFRSDSGAARALAAFWQEVEGQPLPSLGAGSDLVQGVKQGADSTSAGHQQPAYSTTWENRYTQTLHCATGGSAAGGCVGSLAGVREVRAGGSYGGDWCVSNPVYAVNHPVFWSVACGLTVLGSTAGYVMGAERDRATLPSPAKMNEGTGWRTGCAVGAALPGVLAGIGAGYMYALLHTRGTGWIENDPGGLTVLPGALTGLCIAMEMVTIGYRYGRDIDRRNAEKAAGERRALRPTRNGCDSLRTDEHDERTDRTPRGSERKEDGDEEDLPTH